MQSTLGHTGRREPSASRAQRYAWGREAEDRFFRICEAALEQNVFPYWLIRFERTSRKEDRRGTDARVITQDTGAIRLSIKRSKGALVGSRKRLKRTRTWYREQRYKIRNIIVSPYMEDDEILTQILNITSVEHQKLLREKRELFRARRPFRRRGRRFRP